MAAKIKVKPSEPEWKYEFTCPKCGAHYMDAVPTNVGKYAGPGIGYERVLVCTNCQNVVATAECDGKRRIQDLE